MKDLLDIFLSTYRERIKHPVIGPFLLSMVVFNWKAIVILVFSSNSIEDRIVFIENYYLYFWTALLFSVIVTVIYVLGVPYLTLGLDYLLTRGRENARKRRLKQKENDLDDQQEIETKKIRLEKTKAELLNAENVNATVQSLQLQVKERDEKLAQQIDRFNEEVLRNREEIALLTERYRTELESAKTRSLEEVELKNRVIEDINVSRIELRKQMTEQGDAFQRDKVELENTIRGLEQSFQASEMEVGRLKTALSDLNVQCNILREENSVLESQISSLKQKQQEILDAHRRTSDLVLRYEAQYGILE
uniref:Uncharacterized protein n=1 Tax=Sphingobacterium sp. (strain 21) TaxID=743722 RepID=F4C457_SPHS2